jgi:hypothetical protein
MPDEPTPEPEPTAPDVAPSAASEAGPSAGPAAPVDTGYTQTGVPTFESVREKIETRYGTAIGAAELDAESALGRTVEEQYDERQRAAGERLAEIRKSLNKEQHKEEDQKEEGEAQ